MAPSPTFPSATEEAILKTLWFILVLAMLIMYVVLDGFDLGAGALYPFVAKTESERRQIFRAIGPVWDGNEVWLIAAGGTLFFAFPILYAVSFSGFYLPLIIVLWLLMMRGVALELRPHVGHPLWGSFWGGVFFMGSALLAVFYGAALGNVMRGVPIDQTGYFFLPLWTNFDPRNPLPGILDWYTLLTGLLALSILVQHGAHYLMLKTTDALHDRCRLVARGGWGGLVVLTIMTTIATFSLRPELFTNLHEHPWGYLFPAFGLLGLVAMGYFSWWGGDLEVFYGSSVYIAGMMASAAFVCYPDVLPAIDPRMSLTIDNSATSSYGMAVGLVWWCIGMVLAAGYFYFIYRLFRGKVAP